MADGAKIVYVSLLNFLDLKLLLILSVYANRSKLLIIDVGGVAQYFSPEVYSG